MPKGYAVEDKTILLHFVCKKIGEEELPDRLEINEKNSIVYHREGIFEDYDGFDDVEELIRFIRTGER